MEGVAAAIAAVLLGMVFGKIIKIHYARRARRAVALLSQEIKRLRR